MTTALKSLSLLLLIALSLLIPSGATAARPAVEGDAFLCFRAKAGDGFGKSYMVNLGPVTQFINAAGLVNVDLGATANGTILDDLVEIFGESWNTRADVVWSVHAVHYDGDATFIPQTMFASRAEPTPGTKSPTWPSISLFAAGSPSGQMLQLRNAYANGAIPNQQIESENSTKALTQNPTAVSNYVSFMPGGSNTVQSTAFSWFNAPSGIENSFANGTASSVVDFYQLVPGGGTPTHLGGFRLNDSAQLVFSPDISFFVGPAQAKFAVPTDSISDAAAAGKITLTISRVGNTNTAFTLNFSTSDGIALAGTDYVAHSNTPVAFAVGETSKTVDVTIINRPGYQGDRTFNASIALATGIAEVIAPSSMEITILESTPQPAILALSSATYSVVENDASGKVIITVNRSGSMTGAASATLSTVDGTAVGGVDFTAQTDTPVSFAADETTKTVDILITDRPDFQGARLFTVNLASPGVQTQIDPPSTATVTIQDNETNPAGVVQFSDDSYSFVAAGAGGLPNTLVISVLRSGGATGAVSVSAAVAGGTLTAGEDFTFAGPMTVNFADGQTTADLSIPMLAGASPLPGTINLQLSNATNGATVGTPSTATITVTAPVVGTPDRILPKLKVTSPRAGKGIATFDVVGTVQDADTVGRVEVRLNGGVVQNANLGTPGTTGTPFTLAGLQSENGPNVLTVQAFDVKGTASKIVKISFNYVNSRPQFAGSYNGLIVPTGATPPGNNLNNASGFISLKVTDTGAFSGKVLIGGGTLPIAGVFANDQTARFKATPMYAPSVTLAIKGKTPVTIGDLTLSVAAGEVSGTIGGVAEVEADRAAFDGKTPATTPDANLLLNKGAYTAVFPSKAQPILVSTQFPQGDGVGNITLTKQGKVTFKGRLADGTPVTMSAPLSGDLKAPLFAALYKKKGSIAGKVTFDLTETDSDVEGADFLWLRPQDSKAKHYQAGWPEGVELDLIGAQYAVPTSASVLPDLGPEDLAAGNATFVAEDGNITGSVTKDVSISTKNKVTNVPATDKTFKLTITSSKGAISGFFPHPDGTKTAFTGIILQKGANKGGFGYFLTNVPRNAPPGVSGGVSLDAKP